MSEFFIVVLYYSDVSSPYKNKQFYHLDKFVILIGQ